jgi:hypothetical protein
MDSKDRFLGLKFNIMLWINLDGSRNWEQKPREARYKSG